MCKAKLAIILTHPIQYFSPMFRVWAKEIDLEVLYCHQPSEEEIGSSGFGLKFEWDVDLYSGYQYTFLRNRAKKVSLAAYAGVNVPDIGNAIKKSGATHVLIMGWHCKAYIQALNYCNKNKIPVASRGDSILNPQIPLYKKIIKRLYYPYFLNKYDKHFYVGTRNKAYLRYYGVPEKKLLYSPHAVDQNFWKPQFDKKNDIFTFIWVGKMYYIKRPGDAISAFLIFQEKYPNTRLCMIGSGADMEHCKKISGLNKNIVFKGFENQQALKESYSQSHCLLLTSQSETWGLVVNESFSMGLPAIVSNACGCADDMIIEGKTGYTFTSGNVDELQKKMELVYNRLKDDAKAFENDIVEANKIHHYKSSVSSIKQFINA